MHIKEIRRNNLRKLAQSVGGVTLLANRLGRSQAQLSHLLSTNNIKNIGDKLAGEIEKTFNQAPGWLDQPHNGIVNCYTTTIF